MNEEVLKAVNDILHGVTVDTHTEWLQREYIRLMRRELSYKVSMKKSNRESDSATACSKSSEPAPPANQEEDGHNGENR